MYEYATNKTCSTKIRFDIIDRKLHSVSFEDGCEGNLKAISVLVEGMEAAEAVKKLKGILCLSSNKGTSCADQLAKAIELHLK
jgi:uncharacterized protein (TIGR03905 family)